MTDLHNIERSAFTHGAYVGYGAGAVWTITKCDAGWQAIPRQSDAPVGVKHQRLTRKTLLLLSVALENVLPTTQPAPFVDVWYEDSIKLQRAIRVY
jgi:hypothetical protein